MKIKSLKSLMGCFVSTVVLIVAGYACNDNTKDDSEETQVGGGAGCASSFEYEIFCCRG